MRGILFCSLLGLCHVALAHEFTLAVTSPVFAPPIANPRSPQVSLTANWGDEKSTFEGALGARLPFVSYKHDDWQLQLGIDGAGFFDLRHKADSFPLIAADFLMGIPLLVRYQNFSGAFEYVHISAHLGDGLETPRAPITYSREILMWHAAYEQLFSQFKARYYVTLGAIVRTRPKNLGRGIYGAGIELETLPLIYHLAPYAAVDVTYNQDTDTVDTSGRLGSYVTAHDGKQPALSLAITGYVGSDRRGQYIHDRLKRLGVGFFFQY